MRKRLDFQFPSESWTRGSWPVLQKVGFALAEKADVALSLPCKTVLLLKRHLHLSNRARRFSGGGEDRGGL